MIQVRNPHSIWAALQNRPADFTQIIVPPGSHEDETDVWARITRLAREKKVPLRSGGGGPSSVSSKSKSGPDGGRVGQAEALIKDKQPVSLEELFRGAKDRAGGHGLWIALDSLQDPHNVGAIFRTASFFGVQGIILTQERSAPLSGVAYDVSSGGIEHVPFVLQVNLQRAFEAAKEAGLWLLGTSEHARDSLKTISQDRPWLLVLGNEEKGMRRLTEEACDVLCKVPSVGAVTSLNVSVAAGVFMSHLGL